MQPGAAIVNCESVPYSTVLMDAAPDTSCCPPLTRREARREERREAILDVAARYFLEHGYAATTMSGIAAALGGSKGTLWSYYASKELLFADVLERVTSEFRAQLSLALNPDEPVETGLRQFCSRYLARLTHPDGLALHRLVMGEVSRFPEVGRIFYERAPRRVHELLATFLERAIKGEICGGYRCRVARHALTIYLPPCETRRAPGWRERIASPRRGTPPCSRRRATTCSSASAGSRS